MYLVVCVVVLIVVFFALKFLLKRIYIEKCLVNLPGPPTKFIVGNALDFVGDKGMLKVFQEYVDRYGSILKAEFVLSKALIVTDVDFIKQMLLGNINLDKGKVYDFTKPWLGEGLLTSKEEKWRGQRKMLMAAFSHQLMTDFISVFDSNSDILIEKLKNLTPLNSLDLHKIISQCSLDIICETTMGVSINAQLDGNLTYVQSVKDMCNIIADRSMSVWKSMDIFFFLSPVYFKQRRALKTIAKYTNDVLHKKIENRKNKKEADNSRETAKGKNRVDLLDLLLEYSEEENHVSREEIRHQIHTFMFAGHDTTTATMTFLLYELSQNPDIQKLVLNEQEAIFGNDQHRKITFNDLQEMTYLDKVIKETMRMYPAVAVIQRKVTKEFKFKDHVVPEGISVLFLLYSLHHNPELFPNPDIFDPTRFENPDTITPFSHIPFSTGPRNCIGQKFAVYEMKAVISKLIRNFEFRPAIPEHTLDIRAEIVLFSRTGVRVRMLPRNFHAT